MTREEHNIISGRNPATGHDARCCCDGCDSDLARHLYSLDERAEVRTREARDVGTGAYCYSHNPEGK
jgi:hypothetical protein